MQGECDLFIGKQDGVKIVQMPFLKVISDDREHSSSHFSHNSAFAMIARLIMV